MPKISISLATHLKISRHGIFYFRMIVPAHLRAHMGKKEVLLSLHTRDPAKARRLAYTLTSQTFSLFEKMAYDPTRFNPFNPSTFPTADRVRPYEIDLQKGLIKTDSAEDHARAMQALALMKTMQITQQAQQPQQHYEPQPEHTILLSKALEAFSKTLTNPKTQFNFSSFVQRFIEFNGDLEVHKIRGVDVVNWKAELLKTLKPVTVDTRLQALQSLLTWCKKHNYISDQKPLATSGKFSVTKTERVAQTRGAEPFSVEELNKIFEQKAYAAYAMSYAARRSEARYWIPLIALFSGMRLEEVAQLQKDDIKRVDEIDYFDVHQTHEKTLKSTAATRVIPIHQILLDLGFMDYVRALESKALWPELKKTVNGFGNPISKAFIRHLEEVCVRKDGDRSKVFHSLRDTFNNALERTSGVTPEVRLSLMGHAQSGANAQNYTSPKTLQRLKFEGIDLLKFVETRGGVTHTLKL